MGTKHKRKESVSARLALLKPTTAPAEARREFGFERRVKDEKLGRDVAMLRLHEGALANSKLRRAFSRQLDAVTGFAHPNVVPVLEGGTNDGEGRGFLISPYVAGPTLAEVLGQAPLPPEEAVSLAIDLLNGLAAGHHRWLLHGGLAPEGVVVTTGEAGQRQARILHYGFAPVVGEARETPFGEVLVSVDYAAPEMVRGEAIDPRADVYSVGALLFTLLTGRHPVPAVGNDPVRARVQDKADALPASAVSDADLYQTLRVALGRALEQDPALRFPSARSFALALSGQALPAEDSYEDPWAWPEPCPDGGKCSASGSKIPPLVERTWSRRHTDRPFRCRASGQDFSGAEHWDSRGLCAKGARDKPLPEAEGEGPEDVLYEAQVDEAFEGETDADETSSPEPAPIQAKEQTPPETDKLDRREALRELLAADERAAGRGPSADEEAREVASEAKGRAQAKEREERDVLAAESLRVDEPGGKQRPSGRELSDSTTIQFEDAFHEAWDDTRRQTQAATSRMRRQGTRSVERPGKPVEEAEDSEPEARTAPPMGRPREAAPATGAPNLFGWQLAVGVLAAALVMIGLKFQETAEVLSRRERDRLQQIEALSNAQTEKAGVTKELVKLKSAHTGLGSEAQQLRASLAQLEAAKKQLEETAAQREREVRQLNASSDQLKDELSQVGLKLSAAASTAEKQALELTLSDAEASDLRAEGARLSGKLTQAEAALALLEPQLQTARKTLADLNADLSVAQRRLTESEVALGNERAETARLGSELRTSQGEASSLRRELTFSRTELAKRRTEFEASDAALRRELAEVKTALEREAGRAAALEQASRTERAEHASQLKLKAEAFAQLNAAKESLEATLERALAVTVSTQLELTRAEAALAEAKRAGGAGGPQLAALEREKSDLLIELADLEAEREQLDSEGLQLERWLREAEARLRAVAQVARVGQRQTMRLRTIDGQGRAADSARLELATGQRALAVVEADAVAAWIEQARHGEALLAVHVESSGGAPVLKLLGYLTSAGVDAPPAAGTNLRLEEVEAGRYRAWISQAELRRLQEAPGTGGLGILLTGGAEAAAVTKVELVASPLSEDARARIFGE